MEEEGEAEATGEVEGVKAVDALPPPPSSIGGARTEEADGEGVGLGRSSSREKRLRLWLSCTDDEVEGSAASSSSLGCCS